MGLCAQNCLRDHAPDRPPVTIELRTGGDEPLTIETVNGTIRTRPGGANHPDAILTGAPPIIVAVLTGKMDLSEARKAGLRYEGNPETLRRVQPRIPERR